LLRLIQRLKSILKTPGNVYRALQALDEVKINEGKILARLNAELKSTQLQDYEFKIFSQWGEDGIIQKLISAVEIKNHTFIEFGVEDFSEANCRFLMRNNNWSGFVIDGSRDKLDRLRNSAEFWAYQLTAVPAFITLENINDLLRRSGFDEDIGILSVDIDGVDYWVLEAITSHRPRILITEYNSVFGAERKISVPYAADFQRTAHHYSNLYFGASLPALVYLARRKGYTFVGSNSAGVNAFFVRNDLMTEELTSMAQTAHHVTSKARESRDRGGRLTYIGGPDRQDVIRGLPVINVETGVQETL
jgi:hypothetical protein